MPHRTIGVNAARRYLETAIQAAHAQRIARLPTLDALARPAEVSRVTMWKAVRDFVDKGILSAKQGSGIIILDPPGKRESPLYEPQAGQFRWEQIRARIAGDVLSGPFRTNAHLPLQKELAERYGTDPRTLRKSLSVLSSEGLIKRERTRYRINRPRTHSIGSSSIVLVLPDDLVARMQWSYYTLAVQSFSSLIERECHNRGIVLVRRTYAEALHDVTLLRESLGCILWVGGNEPEAAGFLQALPALNKPLAIIDYWFRFALPEECANVKNCLVLTIDEREAMAQVGKYALQSGHRRIAYFRVSEDTAWTEIRLAGVHDAFRMAGIGPGEIRVFDSRPSAANRNSAEGPSETFINLRGSIARTVQNSLFRDMLTMRIYETQSYADLAFHATSEFSEALHHPEITAWICESQSLAVFGALPFLRQKRVPVPQRLSVMAFGDSPEAFCFGLTVGIEQMDRCLEEVMVHILHPALRRPHEHRKIMIPNMVVVRETSGPARI